MTVLQTIKPFWPLLFTFVLPKAINYYRALRKTIRTRPPPRPLPDKTTQSLNILFASICVFFFTSLPLRRRTPVENVFITTNSRLQIPTDTLFTRLASMRPGGALTPDDELLKSKLTTQILRKIYLRFGPATLFNCSFCQPDDSLSYLLYHLPTNIILPHLFHFFIIGLSTSETIAGFETSRWRFTVLLGACALAICDVYITSTYVPAIDINMPSPTGVFWIASIVRPLVLCSYDAIVAFVIYASATGRFLLFPSPSEIDPETSRRQNDKMLNQANLALQTAQMKLRALSIARNAVVRDPGLKEINNEYWREVVAMESHDGDHSLLEDEEVQAAMARAYGNGSIDVAAMRREAEGFVSNVTQGL